MNKLASNSSKTSQQKIIRSFKFQIDQLSGLIIRLSKFYQGAHADIDDELQSLRSHLGGKVNFSQAEMSISKVNALLMENSDEIRSQNAKTVNVLEKSLKSLQKMDNLPEKVQADLLALLVTLKDDETSVYSSLPYFENAINLYQKALSNANNRKRAIDTSPLNSADLTATDGLHKEISEELRELISQLLTNDKSTPELNSIREQLIKGISHQELLECCLTIIRTILKDVIKERKYAEKIVSGLHKNLSNINQTIGDSIDNAESQYQLKVESSESLRGHIDDIDKAMHNTDDLKELKEQASQYLSKMSDTLDSREQADKEEQVQLMNLLNDMKDQLTNLEKEADSYKSRLIEQKNQSHQDVLTKIPNRTGYNQRVTLEFQRWKRYKSDLCMALLDIDHFKKINDNYGHSAGDKTLQVIVKQVQKCLRTTDFIARWGGEEFILLFPQTSVEEIKKPLDVIRKKVESIPFKFKNKSVTITVSIGATNFTKDDTIESIFERTDKALYQAKNKGRNRCIIDKV